MLSRGRTANHLYLPVVGDGDPHAILRPENIRLRTATELLEQILARDATAASATTLRRQQYDPAVQLGHATARYLDALHIAAEHLTDQQMITKLDHDADKLISGLTREAAWPALRARLLLLMADDADPLAELRNAAQQLELDTAGDRAAVLAWRLDDTRLHNSLAPLRWLPGLPDRIVSNPDWGLYLAGRARLIIDLVDQVRTAERADAPSWVVERRCLPSADLVAEIQVWRAVMQVQPADLRPTGPIQLSLLAGTWQLRLDKQLVAADIGQDQQWTNLLVKQIPNVIKDSFLPSLVDRLDAWIVQASMRPVWFDRQQLRVPCPMITRQLLSGGAFLTNYPSGRQATQSRQRQRWRVPALRDLRVSHTARRRDLELMGHPAALEQLDHRPAPMPRTGDPESLGIFRNRDAISHLAGGQWAGQHDG